MEICNNVFLLGDEFNLGCSKRGESNLDVARCRSATVQSRTSYLV
jgi:hypothetical protein